jgi:hypothetical protein
MCREDVDIGPITRIAVHRPILQAEALVERRLYRSIVAKVGVARKALVNWGLSWVWI